MTTHSNQTKMTSTTQTVQEFFTENEWDMIYNFIGNALDNDDYECEDVYAIRAKIHNLFLVKWTLQTGNITLERVNEQEVCVRVKL